MAKKEHLLLFGLLLLAAALLCGFDAPPADDNPNAGVLYVTDPPEPTGTVDKPATLTAAAPTPTALPDPEWLVVNATINDGEMYWVSPQAPVVAGSVILFALVPTTIDGRFTNAKPVDIQACITGTNPSRCGVYIHAPRLDKPNLHYSLVIWPYNPNCDNRDVCMHDAAVYPWPNSTIAYGARGYKHEVYRTGNNYVDDDVLNIGLLYDTYGKVSDIPEGELSCTGDIQPLDVIIAGLDLFDGVDVVNDTRPTPYFTSTYTASPTASCTPTITSTPLPSSTPTITATATASATPTPGFVEAAFKERAGGALVWGGLMFVVAAIGAGVILGRYVSRRKLTTTRKD